MQVQRVRHPRDGRWQYEMRKTKCKMQNPKYEMQVRRVRHPRDGRRQYEIRNAKYEKRNAKCKMQNAKCKIRNAGPGSQTSKRWEEAIRNAFSTQTSPTPSSPLSSPSGDPLQSQVLPLWHGVAFCYFITVHLLDIDLVYRAL